MRILALGSYLTFIWLIFGSLCLAPMDALALQTTQYARVVAEAERIAYLAAQKGSLAAKVATAAVAANPASTAIRLVAGPLGWAALGVSAGLVIAQISYSPSDLQSIKQAASPGTIYSIQGYTLFPVVDGGACPSPVGGCTGQWAKIQTNKYCDLGLYNPSPVPAGWNFGGWVACGPPSFLIVTGGPGFQTTAQEATQTQVQQYVATLPASDPKSIETHSAPFGQGQTPSGADSVETQPVSPTDMPTQVKQKPVASGDSVVADNVPPPSGTPQQTTGQQQTTTTSTTLPAPHAVTWPSSFTSGRAAPSPRFEAAAVPIGGKIYVFGGFTGTDQKVVRTYLTYDVAGGTYTITNPGPYGTHISTAVINQPQVAILTTDGVKKRPVVVEGPDGDTIGIRHIGYLTQTFDHRAFDGAYAAAFLARLKEIIETRDWEAEL